MNKKIIFKAINNYLNKQKKCEKMINLGLSFDNGTAEIRKKILVGSKGCITKYPEWKFFFHGNGVQFTNKKTKEVIDYDYLEYLIKGKRKIGGFDTWRIYNFIKNQIKIGNLNNKKYRELTKEDSWKKILDDLEKEKSIKKEKEGKLYILTQKGKVLIEKEK